ncbi:MAG: hypothetical protein JWR69_2266, partial [Pedosphaera sp.]|nr:hypothetical protein [Pedosphaera sp.]
MIPQDSLKGNARNTAFGNLFFVRNASLGRSEQGNVTSKRIGASNHDSIRCLHIKMIKVSIAFMPERATTFFLGKVLAIMFCWLLCLNNLVQAQAAQPVVAIHDSELTRALESRAAAAPTPTGAGTTGFEWWPTDWHYFVMPESVKEALRSDGTPFAVVSDSNITAGLLLTNGVPRFPILISLASEAIRNDEIAPLTNYVAAGGFLVVGSSAFTRNTNGTTRGDFAFANELGVHMVLPGLTNWANNSYILKQSNHRLVSHIPDGTLTWRLPSSSEEISWGISPAHPFQAPHDIWRVQVTDATVIAQGDNHPFLVVKPYGKGYFIYCSAFQPLIGHGGFGPGMYTYVILRKAIEWAFESSKLPIAKVSPWPYPYDAALMVRHDLEDFPDEIANIEASAQFEAANGVRGDYYFCTGTLRVDMAGSYNTNNVVNSLRRAISLYGATIGPHNGGLKNPNNPSLVSTNYDYWHWGLDEALDVTPPGYASGKAYALASLSNSFLDIESWLPGLMSNGFRVWVAPNFNATREDSYDIQAQLNVKISGDQKISPFPHWTLSTQTPGKRYSYLSEPVSDWYVNGMVAQSLEPWHPPGVQTSATMHTAVDFYYGLGALINFYSHTMSTGLGDAGQLVPDYITYSMNTNLHPRLWSTNAIGIYQWWLQRSNAQIAVSYTTNLNQSIANVSITGAANTNTTVEILVPATNPFCSLQVFTNGVLAGASVYRTNGQLIKIRVGISVSNAVVSYYPQVAGAAVLAENFDAISAPALPAGWTSSATGAQSPWVSQQSIIDSAPNAMYATDATNVGLADLVSPAISLPIGQSQLTFRNNYDLEPGPGSSSFDGGVLEIKIGAGTFTDVLAAGGSFVSGGYTGSIDTNFGNPLAGRPAWSGSSGGFITTSVNLPAATSGQTIQLRWRCGSDNANGRTGWRVDSVAINNNGCLCCVTVTNAPVLPAQTNRTVNELSPLTVTNTASDADLPSDTLFYTLVNPPAGASIDLNGVITWIPSESQGPGTNTITTVVTDSGGLKATNSFSVFINEVNSAPSPSAQTNRTVNELSLLTVTNTATDSDLPTNNLTYLLAVAPANAAISTKGVITWTPSELQGPGTYTFTTTVTDDGAPPLSATNSFTVTVNELNSPPVLPAQTNRTVNELTLLTVTNTASDPDLPANLLSYQLLSPPGGVAIDATGVITWTPAGGQGPSTNLIKTVVTDNGVPPLSVTNTLTVVVNHTTTCRYTNVFQENFDGVSRPALPVGWTTTATGAQTSWITTNTVVDTAPNCILSPDAGAVGNSELVTPAILLPASGQPQLSFRHSYSLESGAEAVGYDGGVLEIKIGASSFADIVTAGGTFLSGGYDHTIDANFSSPIAGRQAWSGTNIAYTNVFVALPASAVGQTIQLKWRCATDNDNGSVGWRVDTIGISNLVCLGNSGPVLPVQTNRTIAELGSLTVTNTATDSDPITNQLTYLLVSPPVGAAIDTNGVITWTPTEAQGPSTNVLTTIVSDNGAPPLSATNSFTVILTEVNSAPVMSGQTNRTINELTLLTVTNTATDTDLPTNLLSYQLVTPPSGASISGSGIITWTPTEAQGPSTNVITTVVTDSGVPPLSATNSFTILVNEVNNAPVLPVQTNRTVNELTLLTVTNTATDADLPTNLLSYQLVGSPAGASIDAAGVIT